MQTAFWATTARLALLAFVPCGFAQTLAGQQVSSHTVVYAVYQGEETAGDVLASMRRTQRATGEQIESYAVVSRNLEGKTTVRDRHTQDARRRAVIDLMVGTLGEPAGGTTAAAESIPSQALDSMKASLTPGASAVIVVLDDRWVAAIQRDLEQARARAVMSARIASGSVGAGAP